MGFGRTIFRNGAVVRLMGNWFWLRWRITAFAFRLPGPTAVHSPRINPQSGQRLKSFCQNGNGDDRREVINVRAKAVILASGGHAGDPEEKPD